MPSTNKFELKHFRCLLYGRTGIGKTTLLGTAPKPFVIATEAGLAPLSNLDIPYKLITKSSELRELWVTLKDSSRETVCIDSLTALSDLVLAEIEHELGVENAMTTYPILRTRLLKIINGYLKLPKHVIMTATETRADGKPVLPSVIGGKLCEDLARLFDFVQFMDWSKDDKVIIHTSRHRLSVAKDRSGELDSTGVYCAGYFEDIISTFIQHSVTELTAPNLKTRPDPDNAPTNPDGDYDTSEIPFDC